jgi:hypothetical protein
MSWDSKRLLRTSRPRFLLETDVFKPSRSAGNDPVQSGTSYMDSFYGFVRLPYWASTKITQISLGRAHTPSNSSPDTTAQHILTVGVFLLPTESDLNQSSP